MSATRVRLTTLSHGAGCACKLGSAELAQVLRHVPAVSDPRVLVDAATRDDAAVFQVAPDRAIVATVDFFTPIVDDPGTFGAIAATNALSDLYAMGATPLFVLNLVAWPRDPAILPLLGEVLYGGARVAERAGALLLGGHSIDDPEPKYGMVAIGEAAPDKLITNAGARPGDRLVLTKPLGTGVVTTALKRDLIGEPETAEAVRWMTTLNAGAAAAARGAGAALRAGTDVTGFGLLGHLGSLLRASGCAAQLDARAVPRMGGVLDLVARGAVAGGTTRNLAWASAYTTFDADVPEHERIVLADAQTSGGLLLAVAPDAVETLRAALREQGALDALVGTVTAGPPGTIQVVA